MSTLEDLASRLGVAPWFHPDEAPDRYRNWLEEVGACGAPDPLVRVWRQAYARGWHIDLVQYPLLRRLYELCRPDPMLYLHLQSVARHTPWASLDEVDGRYLIEAFFFFADHVLTLLERLLFVWYEGYPADFRRRAAADLQARLGPEESEAELADLLAQLREDKDEDVARPLGEVRDRMYGEEGLAFTDRLVAK